MSTTKLMYGAVKIPAVFGAVPAAWALPTATAHRDRTPVTAKTAFDFGQNRHPRGVPL
jgi:hypothetical protein